MAPEGPSTVGAAQDLSWANISPEAPKGANALQVGWLNPGPETSG